MNCHSSINSDLLRAWCDTPSHFLPPDLTPHSPGPSHHHTQAVGADASSPRRQRYTPAEISQQSVDLLLREYYAMVMAHRQGGLPKAEESSFLQRAFLLLCPAPPACLELDHLARAVGGAVTLLATVLVKAAPLLVPVWLGLLRHVLQQQGPTAAALLAAGGLVLLLLAGAIHSSCAKQQAAAAAACITAATIQQQLDAGVSSSQELATLRAASKTGTAPNSSRPNNITQHAARQQQSSPGALRARSVGGTGSAVSGGAAAGSYAVITQDLAALQAALGFSASSSHAAGSREYAVDVLSQVCQQLGVAVTASMTSSPAAMAAAVAQLKQSVGI